MRDTADECFRCGYDLRGIDNTQPCPECGLLAERSRRTTDELHDTRPRWLKSLAAGVWLILLALVACVAWQVFFRLFYTWFEPWRSWTFRRTLAYTMLLPWLGFDLAALMFVAGVVLLTVREKYPPADRGDATLRLLVRLAACVPVLALLVAQCNAWADYQNITAWRLTGVSQGWERWDRAVPILATVGCAPLPLLLFLRLRGLARRARSAHLAEHCLITGVGASMSLLCLGAAYFLLKNGNSRFGDYWIERSGAPLMVMLVVTTASALFLLWTLYLLIRFAIAFGCAHRILRRKWLSQDRSGVSASPIPAGSR